MMDCHYWLRTYFCIWLLLAVCPAVLLAEMAAETPSQTETPTDKASELPRSQQQYRVKIVMAFAAEAAWSSERRRSKVVDDFEAALQRTMGRMWKYELLVESAFNLDAETVNSRLKIETLEKRYHRNQWDKLFLIFVDVDRSQFSIYVREWDLTTNDLTPVMHDKVMQVEDVGEAAMVLVQKQFRPLADIVEVEGDHVQLEAWAGAFPAKDPTALQFPAGALCRPYLRYRDRKGVIRRLQQLDASYVYVVSQEYSRVAGTIITALRSPLGTTRRRNIDQFVMLVKPVADQTRLTLFRRGSGGKPLVGYRTIAHAKLLRHDESTLEPMVLLSNRSGQVRLPQVPGHSLLWLYVYSGDALLARIPYMPGQQSEDSIELPDDSARLNVEGELTLLTTAVIDQVAKLHKDMAFARHYANQDDQEKMLEHIDNVKKSPGKEAFLEQLAVIRNVGVQAARAKRNRISVSRINKLCDKTAETINHYLNDQTRRVFLDEIQQLQTALATENSK